MKDSSRSSAYLHCLQFSQLTLQVEQITHSEPVETPENQRRSIRVTRDIFCE